MIDKGGEYQHVLSRNWLEKKHEQPIILHGTKHDSTSLRRVPQQEITPSSSENCCAWKKNKTTPPCHRGPQ